MRDRLVALLVGLSVALIALYGVPRAYYVADLVRDQENRELARAVEAVAAGLSVQEENGVPVTEAFLVDALADDEGISYDGPQGRSLQVGRTEVSGSDLSHSRPVAGGGEVTLVRSGDVVDERVADALLPLVLIGLALLVTSAVAGVLLARRLSRPFQELAAVASGLGEGRFDQVVPHYAIPEAEAIGNALRSSSVHLDHLVQREREFAVNASHQFLTPITALNLQLDDLRHWPETAPPVAEELGVALATLDRLTSTVGELLAQDRSARREATVDVDLCALTAHVVERWHAESTAQRREIRVEAPGVIPARVAPDEFTQVLDALLDNALRHGQGTVVVDCAELETHLRVRVGDESPAVGQSNVMHRQGPGPVAGLARVAELAEAQGGYLARDDSTTTRFVLMLPKPAV